VHTSRFIEKLYLEINGWERKYDALEAILTTQLENKKYSVLLL
jgi:hypothetical protein